MTKRAGVGGNLATAVSIFSPMVQLAACGTGGHDLIAGCRCAARCVVGERKHVEHVPVAAGDRIGMGVLLQLGFFVGRHFRIGDVAAVWAVRQLG